MKQTLLRPTATLIDLNNLIVKNIRVVPGNIVGGDHRSRLRNFPEIQTKNGHLIQENIEMMMSIRSWVNRTRNQYAIAAEKEGPYRTVTPSPVHALHRRMMTLWTPMIRISSYNAWPKRQNLPREKHPCDNCEHPPQVKWWMLSRTFSAWDAKASNIRWL
jgi:hypothetical protein